MEKLAPAIAIKTGTMFRSAQLSRTGLNKEARTISVRFSTETPVQRFMVIGGRERRVNEVLSHDAGAVNLERTQSGTAVLLEHDPKLRVGITESASITAERNGEAVIRFARTPLGEQCMGEVEDGTLRSVSVGYNVDLYEMDDEDSDTVRATSWEVLEISLVGIPADIRSVVLRSSDQTHETKLQIMKRTLLHDAASADGNGSAAVITKTDFSRELDEVREIATLSIQYQRTHPAVAEMAEKAIKDKTPIREFQRKLMEIVSKPAEAGHGAEIVARANPNRGDRSIGSRFVNSETYKAARAAGSGRISKGCHLNFELPDMYAFRADHGMQTRVNFGLGTSDVSGSTDIGGTGGTGIDIMRQFNLLGQQPLNIADLFSQGTTTGDQVRIVRELTYTNAAARVAEAAAKPQAQLDVGVVNFTVEKTAAYLDVTEEMMNDQEQAASFVNARLAFMVQSQEENYLINGTGSSQITGILNTSGIQTRSGAANTIDALLRAKGDVEGASGSGFGTPDAYLMNPLDYISIRLSKDGNGQYLFGGPGFGPYGVGGYSNVGMLWGLPVVTNTSIAQGTALIGCFKQGAQIFRRMGVAIKTTNSDGSKFLSNIITVLAESRFALAVYQPNKFCSITGIPAAA